MRCKFCECTDLVKAQVKQTGKYIVVCSECDCVYELDENSMPIMQYSPEYIPYFRELQKVFKTWDELTNIEPYTKNDKEE